jgi:hypothetical protein
MTVEDLNQMPAREFAAWNLYARRNGLPFERLELML